MDPETRRFFAYPRYWLVYGLPWPAPDLDVDMAEAAYVLAPPTVPAGTREDLSQNVADLLGFVDVYANEHPNQRVVWFTDVTRWLEWEQDSSWRALGVDWEDALTRLPELPLLGLYMTVSQRAYSHLVSTARVHRVMHTDGSREVLTDDERQAVHEAFARKLEVDWPKYVKRMVVRGLLTVD